jgi:hypothetical protein
VSVRAGFPTPCLVWIIWRGSLIQLGGSWLPDASPPELNRRDVVIGEVVAVRGLVAICKIIVIIIVALASALRDGRGCRPEGGGLWCSVMFIISPPSSSPPPSPSSSSSLASSSSSSSSSSSTHIGRAHEAPGVPQRWRGTDFLLRRRVMVMDQDITFPAEDLATVKKNMR